MMDVVRRFLPTIRAQSATVMNSLSCGLQQQRNIRVQVRYGNLEQALSFLQRKMQSSGTERLIKAQQPRHTKNTEKRVLARKSLERRIRAQDLARKLKAILPPSQTKLHTFLIWCPISNCTLSLFVWDGLVLSKKVRGQ